MNDEQFNMSLRSFLKRVGINGQRRVEEAVREAIADGRLRGDEALPASMTLTLPTLGVSLVIDDTIRLE